MTQTTATRKSQPRIQAPVVFRVYAKEDTEKKHCLGYLVPSDQTGHDPYHVTYNYTLHRYECDCKCGIEYEHRTECKHLRAVKEIVAIRKANQKPQEVPLAQYDVIGEAIKVAQQAEVDAEIGNAYEVLAPTKQVSHSKTCHGRLWSGDYCFYGAHYLEGGRS